MDVKLAQNYFKAPSHLYWSDINLFIIGLSITGIFNLSSGLSALARRSEDDAYVLHSWIYVISAAYVVGLVATAVSLRKTIL
jgi:hypothetical protein